LSKEERKGYFLFVGNVSKTEVFQNKASIVGHNSPGEISRENEEIFAVDRRLSKGYHMVIREGKERKKSVGNRTITHIIREGTVTQPVYNFPDMGGFKVQIGARITNPKGIRANHWPTVIITGLSWKFMSFTIFEKDLLRNITKRQNEFG